MRFQRIVLKKAVPALLAILLVFALLAACVSAVSEQDMAQISVSASEKNPAKGEVVTITVAIDNYKTMSPRIAAMSLSVSYDPAYFDYITDSAVSVLTVNTDDITSVHYNGSDTVSFAYTYANSRKNTLPTSAKSIFTFQLRVKTDLAEKATAEFTVNDMALYNGKNEAKYSEIECKTPITDTVTVWVERPAILLNGSADYLGTYKENVTLTFDTANASLVYEGREAVTVTSPYVCNKNGAYTVTVNKNGVKSELTFAIDKEIDNISVKVGTFKTEYALGVAPDYAGGVLIVTYKDGTYAQLSMNDPDIEITGFDPAATGEQRLLIKYKNKTASVLITVTAKNVTAFSILSPISKTEYLVGQQIDVTGGKLGVSYDDGSSEEITLSAGMLSGYDITYVGVQTVTVTYGTAKQTFTVTYYSREAVDTLILDIDAIDLLSVTLDSGDTLTSMKARYFAMTELEKSAVTNLSKLNDAIAVYNTLTVGSDTLSVTTEASTTPATTDKPGNNKDADNTKIVWYCVGIIVLISVLAGVIYFLVVYFKRKKELDEDEYYEDDEDDDEDADDDLTYDDEDLLGGEGEDDDE